MKSVASFAFAALASLLAAAAGERAAGQRVVVVH